MLTAIYLLQILENDGLKLKTWTKCDLRQTKMYFRQHICQAATHTHHTSDLIANQCNKNTKKSTQSSACRDLLK